jgi:hypothetical protein
MNVRKQKAASLEQQGVSDLRAASLEQQSKAIEWSIKFFGTFIVGSTVAIQLVLHPVGSAPHTQTDAEKAEDSRKEAIIQDFSDDCQRHVTSVYQQRACDNATSILYDAKNRN